MTATKSAIICLTLCHLLTEGVLGYQDDMKVGDGCEGDDDCSEIHKAECNLTSQMCACSEGHVPSSDNTQCLKLATAIGDECLILQQCKNIPEGICLGGECVVVPARTDSPKLMAECNNSSECSSGSCLNGACVQTSEKPSLHVIGQPCTHHSECQVGGSECTNQKCLCTDDFVPSQNLESCLTKAVAMGDMCTESIQCLAMNGVCINEKCSEKVPNVLKAGEETKAQLLGSTCQSDDQCSHIKNAVCKELICECTENYVTSVSSDTCLPQRTNEGDTCEVDKQCEGIQGAVCSQNKCVRIALVGRSLGNHNSAVGFGYPTKTHLMLLAIVLTLDLFRL